MVHVDVWHVKPLSCWMELGEQIDFGNHPQNPVGLKQATTKRVKWITHLRKWGYVQRLMGSLLTLSRVHI